MARFPDVSWFQALADAMRRNEERYRRLGFAEIDIVFEMTDAPGGVTHRVGLRFTDYECAEVAAVLGDPFTDFGADCVVTGPYAVWEDMVAAIANYGRADARHTLNSLVMLHTPLDVDGPDQYGVDKFYRFQGTIQAFLDEAGAIGLEVPASSTHTA